MRLAPDLQGTRFSSYTWSTHSCPSSEDCKVLLLPCPRNMLYISKDLALLFFFLVFYKSLPFKDPSLLILSGLLPIQSTTSKIFHLYHSAIPMRAKGLMDNL